MHACCLLLVYKGVGGGRKIMVIVIKASAPDSSYFQNALKTFNVFFLFFFSRLGWSCESCYSPSHRLMLTHKTWRHVCTSEAQDNQSQSVQHLPTLLLQKSSPFVCELVRLIGEESLNDLAERNCCFSHSISIQADALPDDTPQTPDAKGHFDLFFYSFSNICFSQTNILAFSRSQFVV